MKNHQSIRSVPTGWLRGTALIIMGVVAIVTAGWWMSGIQGWVKGTIEARKTRGSFDEHSHDGHDHGHSHNDESSLELSPQAMGNVGLTPEYLKPVELETYWRSITVPGMVVERPGRTTIQVSTPMSGVITHVHAVRGEAVTPGTLLFELRITAEELITTQTALLKTVGDLEIEDREIARLEDVAKSGAVSQKTLLERQYAKDKLLVLLAAQKEALRLEGLSEGQIEDIIKNRRLLRDLQILAPSPDIHSEEEIHLTESELATPAGFVEPPRRMPHSEDSHPSGSDSNAPLLILQQVMVSKGERVQAGTTLAVVSDLSELYLEGMAFEQDLPLLEEAARRNWKVTAVIGQSGQNVDVIPGLELLYSANDIDVLSRTLRFYVRLPNRKTRDVPSENGQRFVEWRFRPGQRVQINVPVEVWENQIVLPVDAIAQDGVESYVFLQNGGRFNRIPVHVLFRDQTHAVIRNDGSIFPGLVVARRGAHQMQMALKNKSGGGVDPHAGHNH